MSIVWGLGVRFSVGSRFVVTGLVSRGALERENDQRRTHRATPNPFGGGGGFGWRCWLFVSVGGFGAFPYMYIGCLSGGGGEEGRGPPIFWCLCSVAPIFWCIRGGGGGNKI